MSNIRRPKGLDAEWKKLLSDVLGKTGAVSKDFTGTVELSICSGGVASLTKKETFR